jgi:hypothetical protein
MVDDASQQGVKSRWSRSPGGASFYEMRGRCESTIECRRIWQEANGIAFWML